METIRIHDGDVTELPGTASLQIKIRATEDQTEFLVELLKTQKGVTDVTDRVEGPFTFVDVMSDPENVLTRDRLVEILKAESDIDFVEGADA